MFKFSPFLFHFSSVLNTCSFTSFSFPHNIFRRRYVLPTCPVWSCLRSLPTCGGRHFAHTAYYVGGTSHLDVVWRRRAALDVLTGREEDVRATSYDDVDTRPPHVFTERRRTTSVYNT